MKKKILLTLLAIVACLTCIFALSACGDTEDEHVHSYGDWKITAEPTCTAVGKKEKQCACGDKQTETIDALGHDLQRHNAQAATCIAVGWNAYDVCSRCDYSTYEEISKHHNFIDYICTVCGTIDTDAPDTEGLEFILNEDGESYSVCGIGTAPITSFLKVPSLHNSKPVTAVADESFAAFSNRENEFLNSLTVLWLSDSITHIGEVAFFSVPKLKTLILPKNLTEIGEGAFCAHPALKEIILDESNENYTVADGVLFNNDKTVLVCYPSGKMQTVYDIPESVTEIGLGAFFGSTLQSVVVHDNVKTINYYAFYNCRNITSMFIPSSVTYIDNEAFRNCGELENITVATGNTIYHSSGNCVIETESKALVLGSKNSIIPDDGSVTSIAGLAFVGRSGLTNIIIPNNITKIEFDAFYDCSGLKSIDIPAGVTYIGRQVFSGCGGLESITVEKGNTVYHSEGNCIIETANKTLRFGCKNSAIPNDGSVTTIDSGAFEGCSGLINITIPNSITRIQLGAFAGCRGLTSIFIPKSVTYISDETFSDCTALEKIIVASDNTKYHNAGNCLIETATKTLIFGCKNSVIPNDGSVTTIKYSAFAGCSELASITIPDSITKIESAAFFECNELTEIYFNGTTEQWKAINKDDDWNLYTGNLTIHCNDGKFDRDGHIIE